LEALYEDKAKMIADWFKTMEMRAEIARDYQNVLDIKKISRLSWRVWGETKRHRTMPQTVDSVYYATERACQTWINLREEILAGTLDETQINQLDNTLCIPATIRTTKENLVEYTKSALLALETYNELTALGVPEHDAIFIIPRGVRIDVLQDINFYNLLTGYFPLRLCSTADEQLRRVTRDEAVKIKAELAKIGLDYLNWHIEPKCYTTGFCPEKNCCWLIKKAVKYYDETVHEEIKNNIEELFENKLG
jgi:thymidylate synthase ThyX